MTTTYTQYTYKIYERALEAWLSQHIISYANDLVETLMSKELIEWDDVTNLYEEPTREEFETDEEFAQAKDDVEPKDIMQWFIITEEAYNKFKAVGYPVMRFKELYFYGRTGCGQALVLDFYYSPDKIKPILGLE